MEKFWHVMPVEHALAKPFTDKHAQRALKGANGLRVCIWKITCPQVVEHNKNV